MPAKKNPITDADRSRRFVEKAKEIGADESTEGFERVLDRMMPKRASRDLAPTKPPRQKPQR